MLLCEREGETWKLVEREAWDGSLRQWFLVVLGSYRGSQRASMAVTQYSDRAKVTGSPTVFAPMGSLVEQP